MYKVLLDDVVILDPSIQVTIQDPTLNLEDNASGSFSFSIYDDNPGYKLIDQGMLTGVVTVLWDDEILYKGRIISAEKDFYGGRAVSTEGELAYLADTIQRPAEYHEVTVRAYLSKLVEAHNAQVEEDKRFEVGAVTVDNDTAQVYKYTNWESTLECINKDLIETYGGHMRVRYYNGVRYLDYLKDWPRLSKQRIEFGENLLDFAESKSALELATVAIPLGARQEQKDIETLEKRLTIESVNDGKDYVELPEAIKRYGRIVRTLICDDVTTADILKKRGEKWLTDNQYEHLELTLSAVDLADFGINTDHLRMLDRIRCASKPHGLDREFGLDNQYEHLELTLSAVDLADFGINTDHLRMLDRIRCASKPHGLDREFGLTAVSLRLMDPSSNTYTLGDKQQSFSKSVAQSQYQILGDLNNQPTESNVLAQALANATALITMCGKDGHVIFSPSIANPNELYITDYDSIEEAKRCWRWNLNGLGYSSHGKDGPFDLAITMDGTIAGKFIAAGTIGADQIDIKFTQDLDQKLQTGLKNTADSIKMWASGELGDYYTKSEIDVKTKEINLSVSEKVNEGEIISAINMSPESIKISSNKFSINARDIRLKSTALSWVCDNSEMTSDGELTAWKINIVQGAEIFAGNVNGEPYVDFHTDPNTSTGTDYNARISLDSGKIHFKSRGGSSNMPIQCGEIFCTAVHTSRGTYSLDELAERSMPLDDGYTGSVASEAGMLTFKNGGEIFCTAVHTSRGTYSLDELAERSMPLDDGYTGSVASEAGMLTFKNGVLVSVE